MRSIAAVKSSSVTASPLRRVATIADFNQERVYAELTALGATNVRKGGMNSVYANDPIGYEIQINGLAGDRVEFHAGSFGSRVADRIGGN